MGNPKRIFNLFKSNNKNSIPKGMGVSELPLTIHGSEKITKSSDFKCLINEFFSPKIHELGFSGKDFVYYRDNPTFTEVVFFWTFKSGGAIAVDLFVKFKNITYPEDKIEIKPKEIRAQNAEFDRRLSPNGEKDRHGANVWFWIFEDEINGNKKIIEDIWRIFSIRGIEYFNNFKNHKEYISQVTSKNYKEFKDFHLNYMVGRKEIGIIYFLFKYWLLQNDRTKAKEFATAGINKLKDKHDNPYYLIFKNHLNNIQ